MFILKDRTAEAIAVDAGYVIGLATLWQNYLTQDANVNIGSNGLSKQTFDDVVFTCQMVVLAIKLYRIDFPSMPFNPGR